MRVACIHGFTYSQHWLGRTSTWGDAKKTWEVKGTANVFEDGERKGGEERLK